MILPHDQDTSGETRRKPIHDNSRVGVRTGADPVAVAAGNLFPFCALHQRPGSPRDFRSLAAQRCLRAAAIALAWLLALSFDALLHADSLSTTTIDVGSGGDVGKYTAHAIIAGHPAIAYHDTSEGSLRFARNSVADGSGTWSIAVVQPVPETYAVPKALLVVNGYPAVFYYDGEKHKIARNSSADGSGTWSHTIIDLPVTASVMSVAIVNGKPAVAVSTYAGIMFVRAADVDGMAWDEPVTVEGSYGAGHYMSLAILEGGIPAIAYNEFFSAELRFVRAQDVNGAAWHAPATVDAATGRPCALAMLTTPASDNAPAIAYYSGDTLKFARNAAVDGSGVWTSVTVDATTTNDEGEHLSLTTVGTATDRIPVISYYDSAAGRLKLARNSQANANGAWSTVTVPDTAGEVGQFTSVQQVNGTPAVSYYDATNRHLKFARSNLNTDLPSAWTWTISTVDNGFRSGVVGEFVSQAILGGKPAMCYYDATQGDLKFARNSAADGFGTWAITTIASAGDVGTSCRLLVSGGVPMIAFVKVLPASGNGLKVARNTAADGSGAWLIEDVAPDAGRDHKFAVVNGFPWIAYSTWLGSVTGQSLAVARNNAADGSGQWISTVFENGTYYDRAFNIESIGAVDGKPAMFFYERNSQMKGFYVNSEADGSGDWSRVLSTETGRIATVGGFPALSVETGLLRNSAVNATGLWVADGAFPVPSPWLVTMNGLLTATSGAPPNVTFAINTAADGSGTWATRTLGPGGKYLSYVSPVQLANGKPAVAYTDETGGNLKWTMLSFREISVVAQPGGPELPQQANRDVPAAVGFHSDVTFLIRNIGIGENLTILVTTLQGSPDFSIVAPPAGSVPPQGSTPVTIRFAPTTAGNKTTTLHISSNDADETSYDIILNGKALSFTQDTDGDGMSDASELQLAALGFDPQVSQPALVQTLSTYANGAGYYTPSQVQTLNIGTPLISRNPTTGTFKLTIGLQKSTGLPDYTSFPFNASNTSVNADGEIEFEFAVPDNAAFFRLRTRDQ